MIALAILLGFSAPTKVATPDERLSARRGQIGDRFYCADRKLGTWFYCDRPQPAPQGSPSPPERATQRLDAVTDELRELKARAILDPSPANVIAYIRFQRTQLDRASLFGDVWQRAIWQAPDLDYTLQRPIGTVAKQHWLDTRSEERAIALRTLGRRYGLFYFFAGRCGPCRVMSPILKAVAQSHGLTVRAVSTDGGASDIFPAHSIDAGLRATMGLSSTVTPAVVLFDSLTRRAVPVGYGIIAADELVERIFLLTQRKAGDDY